VRLNRFLDLLHETDEPHDAGNTPSWKWLHDDNVGWIHIRFPHSPASSPASPAPPCVWPPSVGWHVDGGHFNVHHLNSCSQSFIILPMVRDVKPGGGGTCVLAGSHIQVAQYLLQKGRAGSTHRRLNEMVANYLVPKAAVMIPNNFVDCAAAAGDVLILHPHVAHAASHCNAGHPQRITFNMGTQWNRKTAPRIFDFEDVHKSRKFVAAVNMIHFGEPVKLVFPFAYVPFGNVEKKEMKMGKGGEGYLQTEGDSLKFVFAPIERGAEVPPTKRIGNPIVVGDRIHVVACSGGVVYGGPSAVFIVQSWEADASDNVCLHVSTSFFLLDVARHVHVNFNPNKMVEVEGEGGSGCVVESWRHDKGDWQEIKAEKA